MRYFSVFCFFTSFRLMALVCCKPMSEDIARANSVKKGCYHLQNVLPYYPALGQRNNVVSYDAVSEPRQVDVPLQSRIGGPIRLSVNGRSIEGELRRALSATRQLGGQLILADIAEGKATKIDNQVRTILQDAVKHVADAKSDSKVAKREVKTVGDYIIKYSFQDLLWKVFDETFTKDVNETISNCSTNEELNYQVSEAMKIITSANLTQIILNNKTLAPEEFENEFASLDYMLVSDRIEQAMVALKAVASLQLKFALENHCRSDHHGNNIIKNLAFIFDPIDLSSPPPDNCFECPCGTIPPALPPTESRIVTATSLDVDPSNDCHCPCGTVTPHSVTKCECECTHGIEPSEVPRSETAVPTTTIYETSTGVPPTETSVPTTIPFQENGVCHCPCGTLPPSFEPIRSGGPPSNVTGSPPSQSPPSFPMPSSTSPTTVCPSCTNGTEYSTTLCPGCTNRPETTFCLKCTTTNSSDFPTTPCIDCSMAPRSLHNSLPTTEGSTSTSTKYPGGNVDKPHTFDFNRITYITDSPEDNEILFIPPTVLPAESTLPSLSSPGVLQTSTTTLPHGHMLRDLIPHDRCTGGPCLDESDSSTETTTVSGGTPSMSNPKFLRAFTPPIQPSSSSEETTTPFEIPAMLQFRKDKKLHKTSVESLMSLWPALRPSMPLLFETDTGRGQLIKKIWFKSRGTSEESSSEERSRSKCKPKSKPSCSSSSEESDSESECSGRVLHLRRHSSCSDESSCTKSCSGECDSGQSSFSSTESSEECHSCSQECSDDSCSSSDDSSYSSWGDETEDSEEEDSRS